MNTNTLANKICSLNDSLKAIEEMEDPILEEIQSIGENLLAKYNDYRRSKGECVYKFDYKIDHLKYYPESNTFRVVFTYWCGDSYERDEVEIPALLINDPEAFRIQEQKEIDEQQRQKEIKRLQDDLAKMEELKSAIAERQSRLGDINNNEKQIE